MTDSIEFVNDWSELETALTLLHRYYHGQGESARYESWDSLDSEVGEVLLDYVPRLLTQYASLLELSFALTEGWEQYAPRQAPSGLYLPGNG